MIWERLATTDFSAIDRRTVVVLPIAAVEQHGPHLPLSVDCDIGQHLLAATDAVVGEDMLILPQIKVACSEHHMDFAGTLTVTPEAFLIYASELLESVIAHGFTRIVIFNSHGGNQAIGRVLTDKMGAAHRDCLVVMATWWTLAYAALVPIQESARGGVNHACEFETSLMMEAHPDSVRHEAISGMQCAPTFAWAEEDMMHTAGAGLFRTMYDKSNGTGTVGDPSFATAEKGARIREAVVEAFSTVIRDLKCAEAAPRPPAVLGG
ncbi:creatininase family protein [Rhodobium gokarnense]|uniref:Creatinine amidohydrolase n=1 Tax=Rhodobium gokarnense TaxID=364296 RepID=A0ABT3HC59_9HYPH|nr:creatininase family protein [Rhodobium gokarnense]MCW2307978.1 creatinine amidohydrolase [Rhodobium gokarnense]